MTTISAPFLCPSDGMPCYVGKGTDDAHHRCGTAACNWAVASGRPLEVALYHLSAAAQALRQHGDEYRAQLIESGAEEIRQGEKS